tara:strand:- start:30 stop:257 length:228 start_codon:yes stop_codon:yes gene_type:complete
MGKFFDKDYYTKQLLNIRENIDVKEQEVSFLRKRRTKIVGQAYAGGMSAIELGRILGMSRQSVYALINKQGENNG